jgi:beta-glucosidase
MFVFLVALFPLLTATASEKAIAADQPSCAWMGTHAQLLSPEVRAAMVVSAMSLDDQLAMLNLQQARDQENILGNQPAYCIPSFVLEDGPNGNISSGSYALPASIATAATFDPQAASDYGTSLALAAQVKGQTAVQAPDLNLAVVPTWGRIAESYGEDPYLTGLLGTAEAKAIVDSGSQVIVKHLSVYTHERNRKVSNTTLDDLTRQEVFEAPFRRLIQAVDPLGVMCAYGTVNKVANCADSSLFGRYRTWGGTGFIRTDLKAVNDPLAALTSGVALFKPSVKDRMKAEIASGDLSSDLVQTRVKQVLTVLFARGLMDHPPKIAATRIQATTQSVATATEVANESMVLLKNSGILPLSLKTPSVAIMGSAAALSPTYSVGGSAYVAVKQPVSFAQALTSALKGVKTILQPAAARLPATIVMPRQPSDGTGKLTTSSFTFTAPSRGRYLAELGANYGETSATVSIDGQRYGWVLVQNGDGIRHTTWVMTLDPGVHKIKVTWRSAGPTPNFTLQGVEEALQQAAVIARSVSVPVIFVASASSEDYDHDTIGLPGFQDALIQTVALANPKTVVVVESARPIAMPWLPLVSGVIDTWLVGQIGGKPVADALTGVINPSGHLPITFPDTFANSISGDALTQIQQDGSQFLVNSDGHPAAFGMHYYQAKRRPPLFPFGFGLSYTTFAAKNLGVQKTPSGWNASVTVTNTGSVAGRAVLQGYVTYPTAVGEQTLQLKTIGSVTLTPGAAQRVVLSLDKSSLEVLREGNWVVPNGTYTLSVGWSATDLPLTTSFTNP